LTQASLVVLPIRGPLQLSSLSAQHELVEPLLEALEELDGLAGSFLLHERGVPALTVPEHVAQPEHALTSNADDSITHRAHPCSRPSTWTTHALTHAPASIAALHGRCSLRAASHIAAQSAAYG
jgi:hypothetical protein